MTRNRCGSRVFGVLSFSAARDGGQYKTRKAKRWSKLILEFPTRKKTGKAKTVLVLKSPKTNSSNRPLYFGPTMLEALKKHQEYQNEEKRKSGEMYNDYDLVIAHPDGSPVEARFIEKKFNDLIEATGLPKVVFHSLRHLSTSLKLKYSGGDIKAVQDNMK